MALSRVEEPSAGPVRGYLCYILMETSRVEAYTCTMCQCLLRSPYQAECGHRFCKHCLSHHLKQKSTFQCPACLKEAETTFIITDNCFPDYACRRTMRKLYIYCENKKYGCSWEGQLLQLDEHLTVCIYNINGPSRDPNNPCIFNCADLSSSVDVTRHNQECVQIHVDGVHDELERLRQLVRLIAELLKRAVNLPGEGEPRCTSVGGETGQLDTVEELLRKITASTKVSTDMVNMAFKEVQKLAARLVEAERNYQAAFIGGVDGELSGVPQELTQLSSQLLSHHASTNGVLLWEIPGMATRLEESRQGQRVSVDSPAFYTSQTGYKIKARMYLNGDGTGAGTHISLFIVVEKGEFDSVLSWPMDETIVFTLFDQSGNREHHKYTFCTDPQSSSFQRPQRDANIASGCPQFISLPEFSQRQEQFVENDVMLVEVVVSSRPQAAMRNDDSSTSSQLNITLRPKNP